LFCALFFTVSWATLYDLYKAFVYRKFAFIGDRGISLLEVKRKNETVTKITIELFNDIDKVIIDTERHYAVGHGGEWVEYIRIKNGRKTFLKIDANHSENYDEFKKTLSKYYQIFKVCRESSG